MRESCDAIIIGAGHNGLTLGAYLARSGLEVMVLERRHEEGGGLCTEELTQPGFLHNVHANYHTFVDMAPPVADLDVRGHGVEYVRPEVQMASVFDDDTALCIYADIDRTTDAMAEFNATDAATFRRLYDEAHGFVDLLLGTLMFQPPLSVKELTKALATFGVEDRSEFLSVKLRRETINQFLDQHFTDPRIKAHLAFHGAVCSYTNDVKGLAIGYPLLVGKINNWHLCLGGSHRLAHALWRDLAQHGGVMVADAEVGTIVVDGGRAVGVRLVDGTEITARKLVASTVSVEQTFLEFMDDSVVGEALTTRVRNDVEHKDWSLFTVHLAMSELPRYTASKFNPDLDRAWVVNLGIGSTAHLDADWKTIRGWPGRSPTERRGELVVRPHRCTRRLLHRHAAPVRSVRARRRGRGGVGEHRSFVRAPVHRGLASLRTEPHR